MFIYTSRFEFWIEIPIHAIVCRGFYPGVYRIEDYVHDCEYEFQSLQELISYVEDLLQHLPNHELQRIVDVIREREWCPQGVLV